MWLPPVFGKMKYWHSIVYCVVIVQRATSERWSVWVTQLWVPFTSLLLLLLLLKEIGNARPGEGDWHPISPKTTAPHYQPIEEKKRKGKTCSSHSLTASCIVHHIMHHASGINVYMLMTLYMYCSACNVMVWSICVLWEYDIYVGVMYDIHGIYICYIFPAQYVMHLVDHSLPHLQAACN